MASGHVSSPKQGPTTVEISWSIRIQRLNPAYCTFTTCITALICNCAFAKLNGSPSTRRPSSFAICLGSHSPHALCLHVVYSRYDSLIHNFNLRYPPRIVPARSSTAVFDCDRRSTTLLRVFDSTYHLLCPVGCDYPRVCDFLFKENKYARS